MDGLRVLTLSAKVNLKLLLLFLRCLAMKLKHGEFLSNLMIGVLTVILLPPDCFVLILSPEASIKKGILTDFKFFDPEALDLPCGNEEMFGLLILLLIVRVFEVDFSLLDFDRILKLLRDFMEIYLWSKLLFLLGLAGSLAILSLNIFPSICFICLNPTKFWSFFF